MSAVVDVAAVAVVAAFGFPLLLALLMTIRPLRGVVEAAAAWSALPAVLVAVAPLRDVHIEWSGVLLGLQLSSAGAVTRVFLLFTAVLWLAAGVFARTYLANDLHRGRFWSFFVATLAGNVGVVLADDVVGFYAFYALMTFAAWGLVVHDRTAEALRAGIVYLLMALVGEMVLVSAFFLIVGDDLNLPLREVPAAVAASPHSTLVVVLLLVGFGVKAGALLLHMWLPLAHPVAPTPASAVLSGAMIKAGLLGWLRFLPLGTAELPVIGTVCIVAGLAAVFYAVVVGVTQRAPKTILAYSSVSQMGFMTATIGVGLAHPQAASTVVAAVVVYALHHALAKGALFLGVGVAKDSGPGWAGRFVTLGLAWSALEIAAGPLTSGALAKSSISQAMSVSSSSSILSWVLSLGAVGSTILMVQFLRRAIPRAPTLPRAPPPGLWIPWLLLLLFDVAVPWRSPVTAAHPALLLHADKLWGALWPVVTGVVVVVVVGAALRRAGRASPEVPGGDVLIFVEVVVRRALALAAAAEQRIAARPRGDLLARLRSFNASALRRAERIDARLRSFETIGLLFVVVVVVLGAAALIP